MKINIYYGGRGLMDDPTLFVLNKMKEVLEELRVTVETFHLYDLKNSITTLPQSLKEADGVILGSTVEVRDRRLYVPVPGFLLAVRR